MRLVVSSGKGGVGKSMLTSALTTLFAKNQKVVAVDSDVDTPNLDIWLGGVKKWDRVIPVIASKKPKIDYKKCDGCGLCAKYCKFGAIKMVKGRPEINPFLCEGCGACAIPCPKKAIKLEPVQNGEIRIKKIKPDNFSLVSGHLFVGQTGSGKVVDEIKNEAEKIDYDLMLIDSAPGTGCPVIAAMQNASFVILVSEPTPSSFADLSRVLKLVDYFRIPYRIVINKWNINPALSNKIEKWANKRILSLPNTTFGTKAVLGKISYDEKIFKAISNFRPIMKTNLKAKKEIEKIFNNLKFLLKKL